MLRFNSTALLSYALLVLIGGIIGYAKTSSVASITSGLIFSTAIALSVWAVWKGREWGKPLAWGLVIFLGVFFAYRFYTTGNWMPAGIMCILSVFAMGCQFATMRPSTKTDS